MTRKLNDSNKDVQVKKQSFRQEQVYRLLKTHPEVIYTQREISDKVKLPGGEQQGRQTVLRLVELSKRQPLGVRRVSFTEKTDRGPRQRIGYVYDPKHVMKVRELLKGM